MTTARNLLSFSISRWLCGFAACAFLACPASAGAIEWALQERRCAEGVEALVEVPCGALGVLQFDPEPRETCEPLASGSEEPRLYSRPSNAFSESLGGPLPSEPEGLGGWVAVVDWGDWHGRSVSQLVDLMGMGVASSRLYPLDDPRLAPLGPAVGDAQVLAQLCHVAEDESRRPEPLLVVNLSFGRLATADDVESSDCDPSSLSCLIARVIDHLADRGVTTVAAAGNHRRQTFPASLAETVATGSIDLLHYGLAMRPTPQWGSPWRVDASVPGSALCVQGEVLPAGSSYAAAFFSGWLAKMVDRYPGLDPHAGRWLPAWSERDNCFVLSQGGVRYSNCNPAVPSLMSGIFYGPESGCWDAPGSDGRPLIDAVIEAAEDTPILPSLDQFVNEEHHPAPESDPCIPCVGYPLQESTDIVLSTMKSVGLEEGVVIDRMFFRKDGDFHPLTISPEHLELLQRGEAGGLVLRGIRGLPNVVRQPSLLYVLKTDPAADCSDPASGACYWTSTPLLLR